MKVNPGISLLTTGKMSSNPEFLLMNPEKGRANQDFKGATSIKHNEQQIHKPKPKQKGRGTKWEKELE